MERLEVRYARALGKERPVLILSCDYACLSQETLVAAPIRSVSPPFQCPGLLKVESLKNHGTLTGFIRLDLLFTFERKDFGNKILHQFTEHDDIKLINGTLQAALGLPL